MKLIIEIDKTDFKQIKAFDKGVTAYQLTLRLYDAVYNGTPLPKGHGRLIDADELCNALLTKWETADKEKEVMICAVMADIVTPIVVGQDTIIEADSEVRK